MLTYKSTGIQKFILNRLTQIHDEIVSQDPEYRELGKRPDEWKEKIAKRKGKKWGLNQEADFEFLFYPFPFSIYTLVLWWGREQGRSMAKMLLCFWKYWKLGLRVWKNE